MAGATRKVRTWVRGHIGTTIFLLAFASFACASTYVQICDRLGLAAAGPTPADVAEAKLPDDLKDLRDAYDGTAKAALALLAANTWVDGTGDCLVDVEGGCIRTRWGTDELWEAFAVVADAETREAGATTYTLCLATAEWADIATLTVPPASVPGEPPASPTLTCPHIASGAALHIAAEARELALEGTEDATAGGIGAEIEQIRRVLATWCATWRPTATVASWDGVVEQDYHDRTRRLTFALDDARSTHVTVTVDMDTGKIEVREGTR